MHPMKWWAELSLCITVTAIVQPRSTTVDGCTCKLIVALPNLNSSEPAPYWERGAEILPGARVAQERINNTFECQSEFIEVNNGQCGAPNSFNLLVTIVDQLKSFHSSYQCLEVSIIGLSCNSITCIPVYILRGIDQHELKICY